MNKFPLRMVFAIVVLVVSFAAIAWSFLPGAHIVHRQKIQPEEMQLPTPSSYRLFAKPKAMLNNFIDANRAINGMDRFVLLI